MGNKKYNITWDTYSEHLKQMLHNLMTDKNSQDVTLVCDDKVKIKAHKIVLKACSPVFETILESSDCHSIYLKGINHLEIESILQFMYLGEATCYQERMKEFLDAAKNLEIKALSKHVELDEDAHGGENLDEMDENGRDCEERRDFSTMNSVNNIDNKSQRLTSVVVTDDPASKQCPDCGKEFTFRKNMLKHHRSYHQEGVRYPCSQCDDKATRSNHLKRHIESEHKGIRYLCNHCQYSSGRKDTLQSHIKNVHCK